MTQDQRNGWDVISSCSFLTYPPTLTFLFLPSPSLLPLPFPPLPLYTSPIHAPFFPSLISSFPHLQYPPCSSYRSPLLPLPLLFCPLPFPTPFPCTLLSIHLPFIFLSPFLSSSPFSFLLFLSICSPFPSPLLHSASLSTVPFSLPILLISLFFFLYLNFFFYLTFGEHLEVLSSDSYLWSGITPGSTLGIMCTAGNSSQVNACKPGTSHTVLSYWTLFLTFFMATFHFPLLLSLLQCIRNITHPYSIHAFGCFTYILVCNVL